MNCFSLNRASPVHLTLQSGFPSIYYRQQESLAILKGKSIFNEELSKALKHSVMTYELCLG